MKKIALCSLVCCLFVGNVFAAGADSCKHPFKIGANNWYAKADEYLFKTEADFRGAVNEGHYYECDSNAGFCNHNTYVKLNKGHVFGDRVIEYEAYYKCDTNGNDEWIEIKKEEAVGKLPLCTSVRDGHGNFIDEEADEYLFPTEEDYKYMKHDVRGDVYECDSAYCSDGVVVTMPAGHVFDRQVIKSPRKYRCVLGDPGNDKWVDITDDCEDCDKKEQCVYEGNKYNVNQKIKDGVSCDGADNSDSKTGKTCYLSCLKRLDNKGGYLEPKWTVKDCPEDTTKIIDYSLPEQIYTATIPGHKKCETKGNVIPPVDPKSCKESRAPNKEGMACCDLSASEAKWENNQCKCLAKNTIFEIVDGKGKCVAQKQEEENHDEPEPSQEKECLYKFESNVQCADGQYVHIKKEIMISTAMDCDQYNAMYGADKAEAMKYFGELCPDTSVLSSVAKLEQFKKYAESHRSGLKTKDGKFNTVRLASDISAGVVLGTVGGVVSGVVIKKKQLEKGYDALHCTVGGQTIADWGDTFSVGLQK